MKKIASLASWTCFYIGHFTSKVMEIKRVSESERLSEFFYDIYSFFMKKSWAIQKKYGLYEPWEEPEEDEVDNEIWEEGI